MHLSLIDAFGASAAPGAPPPGVSALEGGTAGNGQQDAGFATLLDAAAGEPATDTAEADTTGTDAAVPAGAGAIDPTLVSALHAKWWLTALTTTEAAVPPEEGRAGVGDGGEASMPAGTAPDPDDEAVAEWFIAAGADLTALVVVEDVSAIQAQRAMAAAASAAVDTPALEGDRTADATASPTDEAIASRGQQGAGVPASNLTAAGQSNGVPSAAQAPGGRDAAGEAAGTSGVQAAVARADNNNAGESNPAANGADGLPPGGIERQGPPEQAGDRSVSNTSSAATEPASSAAEVAKAAEDMRETAQRGADIAAMASAEGQARAEDRRSSMAAARLASSIERGGGATAVAAGTAPGATDPDSTDPVSAAQPVDQSQSEAGSEDQPSESRERRFIADAQAPPAPARGAAGVTAGEVTVVSSGQPALTASAPAMAAAAGVPVSSTATPDAGTLPQLVQAIRLQVRAGGGDAVVRLNPEHLGAVSISLRVERGVVSATVHAESPAVRQWLEEHESSLRDGLSGHGLFLDRFVVQRDGRQPEQRHSEDQPRYRRRTPRRQPGQEQATFEVRV